MKTCLFILCLFVLPVLITSGQNTNPKKSATDKPATEKKEKTASSAKVNEQSADVNAIKAVIERETKAYFSIDYKTWMECWIHSPSAYWSYADQEGINYFEGWKSIEVGFNDYFVTSKPANIQIDRTWQEVKVYGNGAYARFKQTLTTDGVQGPVQVEIRVLEKEKNQWKILLVGVLKK
jgi:hypothetical protein